MKKKKGRSRVTTNVFGRSCAQYGQACRRETTATCGRPMHERTVTQAGAPIADDIMDEPKHRVGDRVELNNHLRTFCTAEPPMQIVQIAEPFPAALSTKTLLNPSQAAAEAKIGVVMAPHCLRSG